jgi:chemotaxis protein histidine kinase CheA
MIEPFLRELRQHFRVTTRARLQEMRAQLAAVERDPSQLEPLSRHFHGLSGLGFTYGFPRVSELGEEGESGILPVLRHGAPLTAALVQRWRAIVEEVEKEVAGP